MFFVKRLFLMFMLLFTATMCVTAYSNTKPEAQHRGCFEVNGKKFQGHQGEFRRQMGSQFRDQLIELHQKKVEGDSDLDGILYNIIKNNNNPPWKFWKKRGGHKKEFRGHHIDNNNDSP